MTVSSGPKYFLDETYIVKTVRGHGRISRIRNWKQNSEKLNDLCSMSWKITKNNHTKYHSDSRCKKDLNYVIKRKILNTPITYKNLPCVILKSAILKSPDHFVLARDTWYVERLNNTMGIHVSHKSQLSSLLLELKCGQRLYIYLEQWKEKHHETWKERKIRTSLRH